jgi:hypothetical protein
MKQSYIPIPGVKIAPNLLQGPLYFEVIQKGHNLDTELVKMIFAQNIDLHARDEVSFFTIIKIQRYVYYLIIKMF